MKYHTLFFSKSRKAVAKYVVIGTLRVKHVKAYLPSILKVVQGVKVKAMFEKTFPQGMHMTLTSTFLSIKVNA